MKPLRFSPEAADDVQRAFDYYEAEKEGLGLKFFERVEEAAHKIQRNSETPQEILPGLRHVRLKKFDAYALWYVTRAEILVIGCIHGKRNLPAVIKQRQNVLEP